MYEVNTFMQDCVTLSVSQKLLKEFRLNFIMGGSTFRTHFGSFYPVGPAILPQMMQASHLAFMELKGSMVSSSEPTAGSYTNTI
jgi:hypothetical protein